jgi:hypothetical protein
MRVLIYGSERFVLLGNICSTVAKQTTYEHDVHRLKLLTFASIRMLFNYGYINAYDIDCID